MKRIFLLLSCLALGIAACRKELSIALPGLEKKPVLNALLSADSVIYARATLSGRWTSQSTPFQADTFRPPEGSVVKLYEDGRYLETLHPFHFYNSIFFKSDSKVQKGRQYRLTLEVPGYPVAEGIDTIPDRNSFGLSEQKVYEAVGKDGNNELNLSFVLHNTGNVPRHYLFAAYSLYSYTGIEQGQPVTRWDRFSLWLEHKNEPPRIIGNQGSLIMGLLSGPAVPPGGQQLQLLRTTNVPGDSVVLEVSVLSEAAWQYLSTYQTAIRTQDDPTAEKINVYNNIQNGFGIVGAEATTEYLLIKP